MIEALDPARHIARRGPADCIEVREGEIIIISREERLKGRDIDKELIVRLSMRLDELEFEIADAEGGAPIKMVRREAHPRLHRAKEINAAPKGRTRER